MPALHLLLQSSEIEVNAVDLQGRTALHIAAENGHLEACRVLKQAMAAAGQKDG